MRFFKIVVICIFSLPGSIPECLAQHKFEFGVRIDPLVIPVNINTYEESGPGYYDINGKGNITQAGYVDFTYWPDPNFGFSLGFGKHNFKSEIQYTIPDPSNEENGEAVFDNSYPFSAEGLGPVVAIQFRKDRWRTKLGFSVFDFTNAEYTSRNRSSGVTISDVHGTIADIQLDEVSYWSVVPSGYELLQLDVQYKIFKNAFVKLGFETSVGNNNFYPYTLKITGFTVNTTKEVQLLNDFKMRNTYASFSVGVAYIIGFGGYNGIKNEWKKFNQK